MSVAPESMDAARLERALARLEGHCELFGRMTEDDEPSAVRARLELELGPELTRLLLAGLGSPA